MSDEMQGPPPNPLFLERMGRIMTAVACGTPDRVPVSLVMDTFACRTMGVKVSDFVSDVDLAAQTMLGALEKLDADSVQFATYQPDVLGMVWLNPMRLPGRDLPEDTLWQMDEQVRMTREDYDRILEMGWGPWFGQYAGQHLGASAAAMQRLAEGAPRWVPSTCSAATWSSLRASPSTSPMSTSPAAGPCRSSPSICSTSRTRSRRSSRPSWSCGARRRGRWCAPSAPTATGSAAGGRRPSSSRRSCGTASSGRTSRNSSRSWRKRAASRSSTSTRIGTARSSACWNCRPASASSPSTGRPTSSARRRSSPGTCASWATCPRAS